MQVWLICSEEQQQELGTLPAGVWVTRDLGLPPESFDAVVDLSFEEEQQTHLPLLEAFDVPVLVAALHTLSSDLPPRFTRINAWPGFLSSPIVEACAGEEGAKPIAAAVLQQMGRTAEWVADLPGLVSARIVASIINEAYFTLSEGIATRADIDTAMKLGTAYPYGPFQWAEKISVRRVFQLLGKMAERDARYQPCALLGQEAGLVPVD